MVEGRYAEGVQKEVSNAVSAHSSCRDDDTIDCFTSVSSRPTLIIGSAISITVKNMVQFIFDTCSRDSFTYVMIEIRGTNSTINTLHPCRIHVNPPLRLSSIQDQRPLGPHHLIHPPRHHKTAAKTTRKTASVPYTPPGAVAAADCQSPPLAQ